MTVDRSFFQSLVKYTVSTAAWAQWVCPVESQPWSSPDPDVGGMPYKQQPTKMITQHRETPHKSPDREFLRDRWWWERKFSNNPDTPWPPRWLCNSGLPYWISSNLELFSSHWKVVCTKNVPQQRYFWVIIFTVVENSFKMNANKVYWMLTVCRMWVAVAVYAGCIFLAELD